MRGKPITRRTVLSRRDALTPQARAEASDAITARVEALLAPLAAGSLVALYAPKGTEVATARIDAALRARNVRVAYPRVVDGERQLAFQESSAETLVPARFGLREPAPDAPAVTLASITAFVVPGVAFDRSGGRVGWGRGYYDATLAAAPGALRIGVAFECQLMDQVPRDPHDVLLQYVVTEADTYRGAAD